MAETVECVDPQDTNPDKVVKEFTNTIKKLVVILGSDKPLKLNKRVPFDELTGIVKELLKEEEERNKKEISEQLKALLKGHADLRSEIAKKKKELEQLEQTKMKEFNKAARQLFDRVEELDKKEKEYYTALSAATESK